MNADRLLSSFASSDKYSLQQRARYARVIYWEFSFDFRRSDNHFDTISKHFVSIGGIHTLLALACAPVLDYDEENIVDTLFELDQTTLAYEVFSLISAMPENNNNNEPYQEFRTIRQLATEILSEMSNYNVYRRAIGNIYNALPSLVRLFKNATDMEWESHLVERCVNLFANLTLDGNASIVRGDQKSFVIVPDTCPSPGSGERFLIAWITREIGPKMLQVIYSPCDIMDAYEPVLRYFANAIPYLNDSDLFFLSKFSPRDMLELMTELSLKKIMNQDEFMMEALQRASQRAIRVTQSRFHRLWLRLFYTGDTRVE